MIELFSVYQYIIQIKSIKIGLEFIWITLIIRTLLKLQKANSLKFIYNILICNLQYHNFRNTT